MSAPTYPKVPEFDLPEHDLRVRTSGRRWYVWRGRNVLETADGRRYRSWSTPEAAIRAMHREAAR